MEDEGAGSRARSRIHAALDAEAATQDRAFQTVAQLADACKTQKDAKIETALLADIERVSSGHSDASPVAGSIL